MVGTIFSTPKFIFHHFIFTNQGKVDDFIDSRKLGGNMASKYQDLAAAYGRTREWVVILFWIDLLWGFDS